MSENQTSDTQAPHLKPQPKRCTSCMLLSIVFISGLLVGVGLTVILDLDKTADSIVAKTQEKRKSRSMTEIRDRIIAKYTEELKLSETQTDKVREILTVHFNDSLKRRLETLEKMSAALKPILDETQWAQWEKLKTERIQKWSKAPPATQPAE